MASTSDSSSRTNNHKDLKVYVASVSGSAEIRKQIQWTLMVLDGLNVPFSSVDITVRGNEVERDFMRENAVNKRCPECVPMPPQFFHRDEYLGNYADFEEAVENNILEEFLRLIPPDDVQDTEASRGKKQPTSVDDEKISVEESEGSDEDEEIDEEEEEDEDEEEGDEEEDEEGENEDEDEGDDAEDEEYDEDEESDQEQPTATTSKTSNAVGIKSQPQSSVLNKPATKPTLVDGTAAPSVKKEKTPPKKTAPVPPSKVPTEHKAAPTITPKKDKTTPAPPPSNAATTDVAKSGAAQGQNKFVNKPLQNDIKAAAPKPAVNVPQPARSTPSATASTPASKDKNVTPSKESKNSGTANGTLTLTSSKPTAAKPAGADTLANSVSPVKSTATNGEKASDKEHTTDFTIKLSAKGEEKASIGENIDDEEEEDEEYEEEDIDEEDWTYEEVDEEEAVEELPDDKTQTTKK